MTWRPEGYEEEVLRLSRIRATALEIGADAMLTGVIVTRLKYDVNGIARHFIVGHSLKSHMFNRHTLEKKICR